MKFPRTFGRKKELENIQFLYEVLDKMAKNGVLREDVIEEVYWTLKKLLKGKYDAEILEAFEEVVTLRAKLSMEKNPEKHLMVAKEMLAKYLEG
ncbi:hypothetical protein A3L04_06160 [Thermococcus chitonophagus]|uniref:Uncharacterized protein n=2 Tax=Thermococcus chitonophagus TaxID=54262 RepID=A0A2Z2N7P8_9EURY|nr:hypothetical protein [Thermococcus chitonophagus]ASJ16683.1 hypothetical protein A3L04_06160 [Thermococcus chitonophagus]